MLCVVLLVPHMTSSDRCLRLLSRGRTGWNSLRRTWTTTYIPSKTVRVCWAAASGTADAPSGRPQSLPSQAGIIALTPRGQGWILFTWWSKCSESAHSPLRYWRHPHTHHQQIFRSLHSELCVSTVFAVVRCLSVCHVDVLGLYLHGWRYRQNCLSARLLHRSNF